MSNVNQQVKICDEASLEVGCGRIVSLDDNNAQTNYVNRRYESIVEACLSIHPWRFATGYFDLTPNKVVAVPDARYNCAYQEPEDVLSEDTVLINDEPINYERRGRQIHTQDTENDTVILQYRFRADESAWHPYFREFVVYKVAAGIARSVTRNKSMAEEMRGYANEWFKQAALENSKAQTLRPLNLKQLASRKGARVSMRHRG